jgi:hypothetical protein
MKKLFQSKQVNDSELQMQFGKSVFSLYMMSDKVRPFKGGRGRGGEFLYDETLDISQMSEPTNQLKLRIKLNNMEVYEILKLTIIDCDLNSTMLCEYFSDKSIHLKSSYKGMDKESNKRILYIQKETELTLKKGVLKKIN